MASYNTFQRAVNGTRSSAYDHPTRSLGKYSISISPEADVYVGNSAVTASNGVLVKGGSTRTYESVDPTVKFFLVSAGATVKVYVEVFA